MDHTAPQPVPKKIGAAATSWKAPLAMRQILEEVLDPEARGKFPMKPTKLGNTTAKMGMRPMVLEDGNSGRSGPGHPRVQDVPEIYFELQIFSVPCSYLPFGCWHFYPRSTVLDLLDM